MEHRSYMSRTGRSGLLFSLLFLAVVFSPLLKAENTDQYEENVEHEIIILSEHYHQTDAFTQGRDLSESNNWFFKIFLTSFDEY